MSVQAKDLSNYGSQPILLYQFSRTSKQTMTGTVTTTYYRYTSSDRDWTDSDSNVWSAVAISDDGIRQSGETAADQLTITMPYDATVPQMFVGSPPSDPINALIRHANVDETDSFLVWAGVVGGVTRSQSTGSGSSIGTASVEAQVICNTLGATMDRAGVRLAWSRGCPHDLYGFECRANPVVHVVTGTVSAVDGVNVLATAWAGLPDAVTLLGGFIEWVGTDNHANRLGVVGYDRTTGTVRVLGAADKISVGLTVYAFPGCDHTRTICGTVFDNIDNHGGHDYLPNQNPFSGDLVF